MNITTFKLLKKKNNLNSTTLLKIQESNLSHDSQIRICCGYWLKKMVRNLSMMKTWKYSHYYGIITSSDPISMSILIEMSFNENVLDR